jgi:hypothetical protein
MKDYGNGVSVDGEMITISNPEYDKDLVLPFAYFDVVLEPNFDWEGANGWMVRREEGGVRLLFGVVGRSVAKALREYYNIAGA